MALIGYTITVVAKQDNPYNVLPETDISIRKNSDNTLVNIYADEAGLIPIAQLGAKTDSNGQFTFYADASLGILKAVWTNGGVIATEVLDKSDHSRLVNRNAVGAHDAIYARQFDSVDDMVSYAGLVAGERYSTGGTIWQSNVATASSIADFKPLTDVVFEDFNASEIDDITQIFNEANDAAVSNSKWLITNGGDYKIINWEPSDNTKIKGTSTISLYTGGAYSGQNMIKSTGIDGFIVRGVTLDGRNDALSIAGASDSFDNIIYFVSSKNVDIKNAKLKRAIRHFAWFDATSLDKTESLEFCGNDLENGAMDAVTVRRYGDNIRINNNKMINVTNQLKGGDIAAKSISISGSRNVRVLDNDVIDTQGNSSTIIIEYIDTPCVDVIVARNSVNGSSSNGIKVGASEDVTVENNFVENCDSSYYIEGNKRITISNNHAKNTQSIAYFVTQDADTGMSNEDVKILNNTSVNANLAGLSVGVPPSSAGNKYSYHMWIENSTKLKVENNTFSDPDGHIAGGLAVACPYDSIKDNNLSGIHSSAVVFYSNFADGSAGKIENNQGMQTTNFGVATAIAGSSQTNVIHDVLGTASSTQTAYFNAIPAAALSGTVAYWNIQRLDYTTYAIRTRNSSHAAANPTSNLDFAWEMKLSNPKGIYGKTVR